MTADEARRALTENAHKGGIPASEAFRRMTAALRPLVEAHRRVAERRAASPR
jgi:hypothetical protein